MVITKATVKMRMKTMEKTIAISSYEVHTYKVVRMNRTISKLPNTQPISLFHLENGIPSNSHQWSINGVMETIRMRLLL